MASIARSRPVLFSLSIVLACAGILTVALWLCFGRTWTAAAWALCWCAAMTVVTPLAYGYDKRQAGKGGWRVPERTLHWLAILGGSIGAIIGMYAFRHKTVKGTFRIIFWLIVAVQIALLIWLAKMTWFTTAP